MKVYAVRGSHQFSGLPREYYYYTDYGKTESIYMARHFRTRWGAARWIKKNYLRLENVFAYNRIDFVIVPPMSSLDEETKKKELKLIDYETDKIIKGVYN